MMVRGQLSPMVARRLAQWQDSDHIPGLLNVENSVDVLPPELTRHFESLKQQPPPESQQAILDHSRYGFFNNIPLSLGVQSTLILRAPTTTRIFFFIVNTHATQNMFVRFGGDADAVIGVPILANFGFMGFDTVVPQDDIYAVGSGAATTGVVLYSNKDQ